MIVHEVGHLPHMCLAQVPSTASNRPRAMPGLIPECRDRCSPGVTPAHPQIQAKGNFFKQQHKTYSSSQISSSDN